MTRVFTIFNHGTAYHRDKAPDEVVTQLSDAVFGAEARLVPSGPDPSYWSLANANPTHLICDGPGSDDIDALSSSSGQRHAHPGKLNPIFDHDKGGHVSQLGLDPRGKKSHGLFGKRKPAGFLKDFVGDTPKNGKLMGKALGTGWDDNVYKAVYLVTHLQSQGQKPDVINMVGWSRGGVTCLKMANKLCEVFGETIPVNIFAIDPVPGGITKITDDMRIIPANVKNYLAVLALDDMRGTFMPTDRHVLKVRVNTRKPARIPYVQFLPLPGTHADVTGAGKSAEAKNSGMLTLHLAWKFLSIHGTRFADIAKVRRWDLSAKEVVNIYARLFAKMPAISAKKGTLVSASGGLRKERHVRAHRSEYVRDSELFINEHHRQCCLYPAYHPDTHVEMRNTLPSMPREALVPPMMSDLCQMGIFY